MNSPTRARPHQPPRDMDEGSMHQGKPTGARFGTHDDFYDFLDSNRGPSGPGPGPANSGVPMQQPPPSMGQPPQSAQMPQRQPPNQSRPPVTNSFPSQRPPSYTYSGSRSEEMLVDKNNDAGGPKVQRQNGRRPAKPTTAPQGPRPTSRSGSPPSPWKAEYSPPNQRGLAPGQSRPLSSDSLRPSAPGASIQRLKSPSIMNSVLQPLDQKVQEYEGLMHNEQDEMSRLDDEIRALQEKRADAEVRFLEAKGKHDDYRRQYVDVGRALRGEAPLQREPPRREVQRPMSVRDDDDDDDEEEEEMRPPNHRRMVSEQSFGTPSQKMRSRDRFRISLFGK